MARFFDVLAFMSIIIMFLPIPRLMYFFDVFPEVKIILIAVCIISTFISYLFGVIKSPLKKARVSVLKIHPHINSGITIMLPSRKKLTLWNVPIALVDSLKKGDIVDVEYKGWAIKKIRKVNSKTENKSVQPMKSTKARK